MTLDVLERRRLLSVSYDNGIAIITGTNGRDVIEASLYQDPAGSSSTATVNGKEFEIAMGFEPTPRRIVIRSGDGRDSIKVNVIFDEALVVVNAGRGDDRIDVVARASKIDGGDGDDRISVDTPDNEPRHTLFGGNGNDILSSRAPRALLDGGNGDDLLRAGDAVLSLSSKGSTLVGGAGRDTLLGGIGADRLMGGIGDDVLSGRAGDDILRGGPGTDQLTGGPGDDALDFSKGETSASGNGKASILH